VRTTDLRRTPDGLRPVELLCVTRDGVRQVDDVADLGTAEEGGLHGSHDGESGQALLPV
jgi:hypothetical protein